VYSSVLTIHSWLRWVTLLLAIAATLNALRQDPDVTRRMPGRVWDTFFMMALDFQVLFGLVLYFGLSPFTRAAIQDARVLLQSDPVRYWTLVHFGWMTAATILVRVGRIKALNASTGDQRRKHRLTFFALTTFLIVAGIPWPMLTNGRPLFRSADVAPAAQAQPADAANWQALRRRMVDEQIAARGVRSPEVLVALSRVPRHLFVPPSERSRAYEDRPLPIGLDQTISQPYIVAYMTEALQTSRDHKVLEIGTGSGYQAAILSQLVREVFSIEIVPELATRARQTLDELGYTNVHVRTGDGYAGWPEEAPFPRIIVTAAPPEIPKALIDQLAVGGIMIVPVGTSRQEMTVVTKTAAGVTQRKTMPVAFVPMVKPPG
jgi:protein-L-isoaspartate(D-aspartate) O-methyltransferase